MDDDTAARDALARELGRLKPVKLRVVLTEGEPRDLAIMAGRKRWHRALDTLAELEWLRIECLDSKNALLGIIKAEGAIQPETRANAPREYALLDLLRIDRREMLEELRKFIGPVMEGYNNLAGVLSDRLGVLERNYAGMLNAATKAQMQLAQVGADADPADQLMLMAAHKYLGIPVVPAQAKSAETAKNGKEK